MSKVLIVDDEAFILTLLQRFFSKLEIENGSCSTVEELDAMLDGSLQEYCLCFVDYHFYDRVAIDIVSRIKTKNPEIKCVVMSGDPDKLNDLKTSGKVCATLNKPFRLNDLQELLEKEGVL